MSKRGALIKNERFKLYKKPSTIVVIVLLVLISLFLFAVPIIEAKFGGYLNYTTDWKSDLRKLITNNEESLKEYESRLETYEKDGSIEDYYYAYNDFKIMKSQTELYNHILDNDISLSSWKLDILAEYFSLKNKVSNTYVWENGMYDYGFTFTKDTTVEDIHNYFTPTKEDEAELERLQSVLKTENWKDYLKSEIEVLEKNNDIKIEGSDSAIQKEIYEMHLEMDIEPYPNARIYEISYSTGDAWKSDELNNIARMKKALINKDGVQIDWNYMGNSINSIGSSYPYYNSGRMTHIEEKRIELELDKAYHTLQIGAKPYETYSVPGVFNSFIENIALLIAMFGIFIGGSVFSSEFSSGTIKLLVITPYRRQKIYWAKVRCLLEAVLGIALAIFLLGIFLIGILTGFKDVGTETVAILFGKSVAITNIINSFIEFAKSLVAPLMYTALAVMLSVTSRKSSPSIAIPMLVLVIGVSIFSSILYSSTNMVGGVPFIFKFAFFLVSSKEMYSTLSISYLFAFIVMAITTVCFAFIGRDSFCRRDIK